MKGKIHRRMHGHSPYAQIWGRPHHFPWQPPSILRHWDDSTSGGPGKGTFIYSNQHKRPYISKYKHIGDAHI